MKKSDLEAGLAVEHKKALAKAEGMCRLYKDKYDIAIKASEVAKSGYRKWEDRLVHLDRRDHRHPSRRNTERRG